ncbi:carboxypeptidase-like regulatory domain-containing protein [Nonlabens antarcticus]|uniref:carboxypeptidase-like regulatory domain-containing protein n=1 Tax=Nonlabens antarcticus TaxID=392714 RepID=UPI001891CC2F|nr:carboxypeptidase-like regulatory domain-containing protein [Nonlabens antarcticus]
MNIRLLFLFLPFLSLSQSVQIQDSQSKESIPFVNIWIKGSPSGTTSNENGRFELVMKVGDTLVLSAIGYERSEVPYRSFESTVTMNRSVEQLDAVVIKRPKVEKEQTFGKIQLSRYNVAFGCYDNPWMIGSNLPFKPEYEETPYLKTVVIATSSDVENAKFGVRFFKSSDSLFKTALQNEPIYILAEKGNHKTKIDLSDLRIRFLEEGMVIVFEFLIIPSNKYEFRTKMRETGKKITMISYEPSFYLRNDIQTSNTTLQYSKGKWQKNIRFSKDKKESELALQLVMTN